MSDVEYSGVWQAPPARGNRSSLEREQVWRHRLIRLGFIWGAWTLVGFFFASQIYVLFLRSQRPVSFSKALVWQLSAVYLLALATPLVLWLARRFRIERHNWPRNVLIHGLTAVLICTTLSAAHVILDQSFDRGFATLTPSGVARGTFVHLDQELIIYWLIVLIGHAFDYYRRFRESELSASRLATRLAEAQLQALKMQLHPHFLFNTLHSISALVHKDPEAADKMIARLGDFLRLTLENSGTQEVVLQQELEFLKCYLDIERIRFHDRLSTHIDVDPRALDFQVPNLILQPIVENAIRHGIAPRSAPGRIEIRAERAGSLLRLQVRDNGPGLGTETGSNRKNNGGIGLSNTRARLRQLYGDAHRFELSNDPKGGLVVTLDIPD
ncbi:MAG: sensor histidine kinase, partial [Pyrinomonadaceae bacterium]